jgi:hypothetical protein
MVSCRRCWYCPRPASRPWPNREPAKTSSGFTWKPLMSLGKPSHVPATTGREQGCFRVPCFSPSAIIALRTVPSLGAWVTATAPSSNPDSSPQFVPVISPLPSSQTRLACAGSVSFAPRGGRRIASVRTQLLARSERALTANRDGRANLNAGRLRDRIERTVSAVKRNGEKEPPAHGRQRQGSRPRQIQMQPAGRRCD